MSDASHIQDDWETLAQRMRLAIAARINDIGAMKPDEIEHLADAARATLFLELNAQTFDKLVELELAKVTA